MFDPYHKWLGIPKDQRPPTLYQLVGVSPQEDDPEVLEEASLMRIAHVRNYQLGPHAAECSRLLHELGEASATLCDPARRAAYDAELAKKVSSSPAAAEEESLEAPAELVFDAVGTHTSRTARGVSEHSRSGSWDDDASPRDASARRGADRENGMSGHALPTRTPPPFHDAETPAPQTWDRTPADEFPFFPSDRDRDRDVSRHSDAAQTPHIRREDNEVLRKLSDKALTELRQPIHIEDESWWDLTRQMIREWVETLEEWGIPLPRVSSTFLRRVGMLAVLGAAVWLVVLLFAG